MAKITIVNAHWSNRGDEAALRPIINKLIEKDKNEVTIIFKDKDEVRGFPYVGVRYFSTHFLPQDISVILDCIYGKENPYIESGLRKTIDVMRRSDLVIYSPGGRFFQAIFGG